MITSAINIEYPLLSIVTSGGIKDNSVSTVPYLLGIKPGNRILTGFPILIFAI